MPQDQRAGAEAPLPLFPPIEPYDTGMLDLDAPHRMYYEQSGNPRGVAAVFIFGLVIWGVLTMLVAGIKEHME